MCIFGRFGFVLLFYISISIDKGDITFDSIFSSSHLFIKSIMIFMKLGINSFTSLEVFIDMPEFATVASFKVRTFSLRSYSFLFLFLALERFVCILVKMHSEICIMRILIVTGVTKRLMPITFLISFKWQCISILIVYHIYLTVSFISTVALVDILIIFLFHHITSSIISWCGSHQNHQ